MSWSDQFKQFPNWVLALWVSWAAQFAVLETMGIMRPKKYPTLSYLCRAAIPAAILAAFCGWLVYHFTYQTNQNIK